MDYEYVLSATGGIPPLRWSIKTTNIPSQFAAGLPAGLSLDAVSGELSGRAAEPGVRAVFVEVIDAEGKRDEAPLALGVFAVAVRVSQLAGSDTSGIGTPDAPFASINRALALVTGSPAAPVAILAEQGSYQGPITLTPNVSLYGGYEPGTVFQGRDESRYVTVLEGAGTATTLTMADSTLVDGCSVTGATVAGIASGTLTQTLIANCRVFGNGGYDALGTGIALTSAAPVIVNSRIHGNRASYYHGTTYGGGLRISTAAAVVRNLIYANSIDAGGPGVEGNGAGLAILGGSAAPYVADNVIAANLLWANNRTAGAGILCTAADAVIERNLLVGNRNVGIGYGGNLGGAIYVASSGIAVRNNVIFGNDGYAQGGGVYAAAPVSLLNNTFAFNRGPNGGGGVNWAGAAGMITRNNLFVQNNGFDIAESGNGAMILENNDFFGNPSGLYLDNGITPLIGVAQVNALSGARNNLAIDPLVLPLGSGQRGISTYDGATATSAVTVGGAAFTPHEWVGSMLRLKVPQTAWFYVLDNDTNTLMVTGNIDSVPLLAFESNVSVSVPGDTFELYDYHLRAESPVIDQGIADQTVPRDIDLDSRLTGPSDIGADEHLPQQ